METLTIDGIEITIAPPARTAGKLELPGYTLVTSPSLPDGVTVAFYPSLTRHCLVTFRPGKGRKHRTFRTIQEAREAAVKYVVNRAKEARKAV